MYNPAVQNQDHISKVSIMGTLAAHVYVGNTMKQNNAVLSGIGCLVVSILTQVVSISLGAENSTTQQTNRVTLPEIPYPKSDVIQGIRWLGNEIRDSNPGDVWSTTWADDDNLYSMADDPPGFNLCIHKIEGMPPDHKVTRFNEMLGYLPKSGIWWKGTGLTCIDGVLPLRGPETLGTVETRPHPDALGTGLLQPEFPVQVV